MALFDKVLKKETQARLDKLVEDVTLMLQELENRDELPSVLARKHASVADANCTTAIKRFAEQSFGVSLSLVEKAELHLHMGRMILVLNEAERLDLHFPANTANALVVDLCNAISDLKFSVEYTNAKVPEENKQTLMTVMDLWWESCESLSRGDEKTARRFAEVGLLLLDISVLSINVFNDQQAAPVVVRNTFSNPLFTKIRQFAEQLSQIYDGVSAAGGEVSPQAREHLSTAAQNLSDTISHLVAGEDAKADSSSTAGLLELKYVQRLAPTATGTVSTKSNPIDIRQLREQLAAKVQSNSESHGLLRSLRVHEARHQRGIEWTDAHPTGGAITTYNRIVDLLSSANIDADTLLRALSKLQSAVHFLEQAKKKSDRTFADDLCAEALNDLAEARALCL
jgi:hypothetical protein